MEPLELIDSSEFVELIDQRELLSPSSAAAPDRLIVTLQQVS